MKKSKKLTGPSNDDIPEPELIVAELAAFTKEKGWVACQQVSRMHGWNGIYAVCALGAASEANISLDGYADVASGNDRSPGGFGPGYDIGAAFYDICKPDLRI